MAPIHDAAMDGDVETLRRLLAKGSLPNAPAVGYSRTPLHFLCITMGNDKAGDRAACFELLRNAGANLEAIDNVGYTPLHCAAISIRPDLLSLLCQAGVNVDAATPGGSTALHLAVRMRANNNCIEVLLAAGASLNLREGHGRTPFDLALLRGYHRMWPLFLRAGAEIPTDNTRPYIVRVRNAGGIRRYAQQHLARIASILETPLLPPELVRKVLEFWLHAGYY